MSHRPKQWWRMRPGYWPKRGGIEYIGDCPSFACKPEHARSIMSSLRWLAVDIASVIEGIEATRARDGWRMLHHGD